MSAIETDVDSVELHCPGCKTAIVDVRFEPNADGGRVSIDHATPPCAWWNTPDAKKWAISIVTEAITHEDASVIIE